MDGMSAMMGWMMGLGLLGWVLLFALAVTVIVLAVQWLTGGGSTDRMI